MTISRHSNNKLILIKKKHSYDIKSGYIIKAGSQVQVMLYYFEKKKHNYEIRSGYIKARLESQ
jgi:hypothetical protein